MYDLIYLDNSATTKPHNTVIEAMDKAMTEDWYNPSSLYIQSVNVQKKIQDARKAIALSLNVKDDEVFFNSGGSEGDYHAIMGCCGNRLKESEIIVSTIEHSAVYETCLYAEKIGAKVIWIKPNKNGFIEPQSVLDVITPNTNLVSIMHVNNETGSINDIEKISKAVKMINPKAIFHSDGVQAYLKIPLNLHSTCIDIYNISAHKIHGPKGIGAIYIKKGTLFKPLILGGKQEAGMRAGTENIPGILGFSAAVQIFKDDITKRNEEIKAKKETLAKLIKEEVSDIIINSQIDNSSSYILSISAQGVRGETVLHSLEEKGILVGTGSACNSHKKISRVLNQMVIPDNIAEGTIRVSFGLECNFKEFDRFVTEYKNTINKLREFRRR